MKTRILEDEQVLAGYDAVCALYPYVPSLSHWRAWEHAAYREFALQGRILDLGCGDGRYFRLLWPGLDEVVGVEIDPGTAQAGRESGVYAQVHVTEAHHVPEPDGSFDHVFANCSLEHMDRLDDVLAEAHRCLRPGGTLLCSVVTDRFESWALLPGLVAKAGHRSAGERLAGQFREFHHLRNPLSVAGWTERLRNAGLQPEVHLPIVPMFNSGFFLLVDGVWHVSSDDGELGGVIHPFLALNPRFPAGFRTMIAGLLQMEGDRMDCSGAVFSARKPMDPRA
jgi:SAM-dependent methyltransferase